MKTPAIPVAYQERATLEAAFAARLTAHLSQSAETTPPGVAERLHFARERALERARAARRVEQGPAFSGRRSLGGGIRWWMRLTAVLPLIALVAGLVLIQERYVDAQVSAAAEIDTALLADDLPPAAYADSGFAEFLKVSSRD